MATLNQNINQAISDFGSIKTAIESKGVTVPSGTPTSQYASKINSIQTGITPSGTVQISQNGTVDVTQYASASVNVSGGSDAALKSLIDRSLTSFNIPTSGINIIGASAFEGCSRLTSISVPANISVISSKAFANCTALTNISLTDHVGFIGGYAFWCCSNLTSFSVPANNNLIVLPDSTFGHCSHLESIVIPRNITIIEKCCFDYCSRLTDVYYTGTQAEWEQIDIVTEYDNDETGESEIPTNEYLTNATIHYNYTPA